MRHLDVSYNALSGTLPQSVNALTQLVLLGLHGNELVGPMPDLGGLVSLSQL